MKAFRRSSFVGLVALAVVGCGSIKEKKLEQQANEAIQQQVQEMQAQWVAGAESDSVRTGWIADFDDPVLSALVLEAQQNNRDLAAASKNVDRAWALADISRSNLMPEVNAVARGTRIGDVGSSSASFSNMSLAGQVSWEVDVWGRLAAGRRAAVASAQAVEADLRSAQQSLAAATAKTYFTAIETQVQLSVAEETVRILEEVTRIVNVRYENGMSGAQDLAFARSDLATARESKIAIEGTYRNAVRALELLLGRYPAAELELRQSLPAAPPAPPAGIPSELLERRPDIVAAERRVASAFNATEQARTARLPAVALTGAVGNSSSSLSDLVRPDNAIWLAGASLLAPIYDGGRRRAAQELATAEQEQALAAYGAAALKAFGEVESNLDQGVLLAQRVVALEEATSESESALTKVAARYREGEEDLLSLLTIQRRVTTANSALARVERLQLDQRVNLNLALGGDWEN